MQRTVLALGGVMLLTASGLTLRAGPPNVEPTSAQAPAAKSAKPTLAPDALDRLHAPIALSADQLLAHMFLCAQNPGKVAALGEWLAANSSVKGTDLQDAATKSGFEPSFVAMTLFPDVVNAMASNIEWTDPTRASLRCGSNGYVRKHPAVEREGQGRRHAEEHTAAGRRDPHHVVGRAEV